MARREMLPGRPLTTDLIGSQVTLIRHRDIHSSDHCELGVIGQGDRLAGTLTRQGLLSCPRANRVNLVW
uniref:Uncharacterized protein n=1 Tax=Timema douglasi TaxID=61478 RepID=A0A7R8VIU1_TIMDO|nr:unnamed protein product [Timema douglasi]